MDYLPMTRLVKVLVENEEKREDLNDAILDVKEECEAELSEGLPPREAEKSKSLVAAMAAAEQILDFVPRFYEEQD